MRYATTEQSEVRLSALRTVRTGSSKSHRPTEATTNLHSSSRPRTHRPLWLAILLSLCFIVPISTLSAQSNNCAFADVNGDGVVDDADLLQVLFCFGTGVDWTIPVVNQLLRERLVVAFPDRFRGAPEVPFSGNTAAFASVRGPTMDPFFDVFVAWETRRDFHNFSVEEIAQGLVVGAVYLPEGSAPTGQPMAEGYYLVRMRRSPDGLWVADVLDHRTGLVVVPNLIPQVQLITPQPGRRTWNDIAIHVLPQPGGGFCIEIELTFMCPNGLVLESLLIWRRCFP